MRSFVPRAATIASAVAVAAALAACGSSNTSANGVSTPKSTSGSKGSSSNGSTIVIGEPEALTGADAAVGGALLNGTKLAADLTNARGGVQVGGKRYRVVVKPVDFASNPAQAPTAVEQLLTQDQVKFMVGPNISLAFAPAATLLARSGDLVLSTATTLQSHLGQAGYDNMFDLAGTGASAAFGEADALHSKFPSVKRVAILLPGDSAGLTFQTYYAQAFKKVGISVIYNQTFPPATTDYTSQLTAIKSLHPDALLTGEFDPEVKPMIEQAMQLGVTKTFVAAGTPSSASGSAYTKTPGFSFLWEIPGPVLAEDQSSSIKTFKTNFKHYLGRVPNQPLDYLSTITQDGALALLQAMSQAGTVSDPSRVASELTHASAYSDSAVGLRFSTAHTAQYTNSLGLISGGKITYSTFTPAQP